MDLLDEKYVKVLCLSWSRLRIVSQAYNLVDFIFLYLLWIELLVIFGFFAPKKFSGSKLRISKNYNDVINYNRQILFKKIFLLS